VKLAVLAAGIDAFGQIGQQLRIEFAACKFGRQFFQIDGGEISFKAACDHRPRQRQGRSCP
jgi:hypothetical protein